MTSVRMYATYWCPYCTRARALLQSKGVDVEEIDVDADPGERATMIRLSGRTSVPQIFIDERHVGGSDDLAALEFSGELDRLLGLDDAAPENEPSQQAGRS